MRKSGILLPVFSLPSEYGIGTLGKSAKEFIDFLHDTEQYYWMILPIGPTSYGDSPYQSPCAFAGNPYFIDLDLLCADRLITTEELTGQLRDAKEKIDYGWLYRERLPLLMKAAERFSPDTDELDTFRKENSFWLEDYCLFMAYKHKNGMKALPYLKENAPVPDEETLRLKDIYEKMQFIFFSQWQKIKNYAESKNIHIIGDIPIYVSRDSSDYFSRHELFSTDEKGEMRFIAGCPPDDFAKEGQLWGNPLYAWHEKEQDCFFWWRERLRHASRLFHAMRIDHFRGFYEYYAIPYGENDTSKGQWLMGPGLRLCQMIRDTFPDFQIFTENLGFMTEDVRQFFHESGFPGMRIMQFAFDSENSEHLPQNHERKDLCMTGTHDNPTLLTWLCNFKKDEISFALDYLGCRMTNLRERVICAAMGSVCDTAVIPLQDYMGLGCDGRINTPGTTNGNWQFRITRDDLADKLREDILFYTKTYSRRNIQ